MDIVPFVESDFEPSELVGQSDGLFDDSADGSQPAAVSGVSPGQERLDVLSRSASRCGSLS